MKVAAIKGYTHTPGAPRDWNPERNGPCGALPIVYKPDTHGNMECVSAWKPTPDELRKLNEGGYVMLSVVGWQVPVSLWAEDNNAADDMQ